MSNTAPPSPLLYPHPPPPGPELVLALVGALGADLNVFTRILARELQAVGYNHIPVRLSSLLHEIREHENLPTTPLDKQIRAHQKAGNQFRSDTEDASALAALGISAIQREREKINTVLKENGEISNDTDVSKLRLIPLNRRAFVVRSIKHVAEIQLLRQVYGDSVLLLGVYSPRQKRAQDLAQRIAESHNVVHAKDHRAVAEDLINKDEQEPDNYGQQVKKVFPLADAFFDMSNLQEVSQGIERFVEVLFGHPFQTPTQDEYLMFLAKGAALRSSDLSRQVGAVIATEEGNAIAVGTNEVPKAGGGLYWPGDNPDVRDFQIPVERSHGIRRIMIREIVEVLREQEWLSGDTTGLDTETLYAQADKLLGETQVMQATEYGRTVHAEMAALMDAAYRGVSVAGHTLYCTTFPCHNCAKHIVASGVMRVVYIEPYPKSLAATLHEDSVAVESIEATTKRVRFEAFEGIGPAQYLRMFTAPRRDDKEGNPIEWKKHEATPRISESEREPPYPYTQRETRAIRQILNVMKSKGIGEVS